MTWIMGAGQMKGPVELSLTLLRFIGACEVLGALGLVLPWLTRIRPGLTPLAASGLVIIMIVATATTLIGGAGAAAAFPAAVGILAAAVAWGRR